MMATDREDRAAELRGRATLLSLKNAAVNGQPRPSPLCRCANTHRSHFCSPLSRWIAWPSRSKWSRQAESRGSLTMWLNVRTDDKCILHGAITPAWCQGSRALLQPRILKTAWPKGPVRIVWNNTANQLLSAGWRWLKMSGDNESSSQGGRKREKKNNSLEQQRCVCARADQATLKKWDYGRSH